MLTEKTVQAIGKQLVKDVGTGVEDEKPGLIVIVKALAKDAWDELGKEITRLNFPDLGRQMDAGIAQGISDNSGLIESAARAAAAAAFNAAKAELQINSPSKKGGWIGEMFDLGFAGGLRDNADEIESAMGFLNDVAAAEVEPVVVGGNYARQQPSFEVDYERMKGAFVEAIEETRVGDMVMAMDGRIVGETVEPYSSRATSLRQQKSVRGRTARLMMR